MLKKLWKLPITIALAFPCLIIIFIGFFASLIFGGILYISGLIPLDGTECVDEWLDICANIAKWWRDL
jgi:hypothetical protein